GTYRLHVEGRAAVPDAQLVLEDGSAAGEDEIRRRGRIDDQIDLIRQAPGRLERAAAGFERQIAGGHALGGKVTGADAGAFDDPLVGRIDAARAQVVVAHRHAGQIAAGAGNPGMNDGGGADLPGAVHLAAHLRHWFTATRFW